MKTDFEALSLSPALLAVVLIGEVPGALQWVAGSMILAGLAVPSANVTTISDEPSTT